MIETQILRCVVGSQMYGLATDSSDRDEAGIFMETPQEVCGLTPKDVLVYRDKPAGVKSEAGDLDLCMYSLRKFVKLAANGNPSILQLLYSPKYILLTKTGQKLVDFREHFYSKKAGEAFLGYLISQRMKLTGDRAQTITRTDLIEKYGYDTKFAMHSVRLALMGIEYMHNGNIELPVSKDCAELLIGIRNGAWSLEEVLKLITDYEKVLKESINRCTKEIDKDKINKFVSDAHLEYWSTKN